LARFLNTLASFALPEVCICCETLLLNGQQFVCPECSSKLHRINDNELLKQKLSDSRDIDYAVSLYEFIEDTDIQTIIHSFKYGHMKSIGKMFGRELGAAIGKMNVKFDYVIPVPLHRAKRRERTYNQSDYICYGISEVAGVPVIENCLKRIRYTKSQTKLKFAERQENVKDAFRMYDTYSQKVKGENIILADDLITTGSTIMECARILKTMGCGKILACSIALAM
jgi:ComF family protein